MKTKHKLIVLDDPMSQIAEEYKILRTNIEFSLIDKENKVIMITSSMQSEGKTTVTSNLAVTLQQLGKKIIIVDCDQRRPRIHKQFGLSNLEGLADYLARNLNMEKVIKKTEIEGLDVLTAGTIPPNPSELLASKKMKNFIAQLKEMYDYVILDTPPSGLVTDAHILSKYSDGVVLVVASNQVEKNKIVEVRKILKEVDANIIGVVLNKVEVNSKDTGYYGEIDNTKNKKSIFDFSRKSRRK